MIDIREIIRRVQLGDSDRCIARDLELDRRTVGSYRQWAEREGLLAAALPPLEELKARLAATQPEPEPPQNRSTVAEYEALVRDWLEQKVEIKAIHERLKERGFTGSYSAVYRFARRVQPTTPDVTVRVERPPGEEAQVDFGYAGEMYDPESGKLRQTWAFVMTLSWSRHQYVEFVWNQRVETWLRCHRNAFEFFEGVPARVVVDNLKAAITRATQDEPQVQHSYRECALHYGFRIGPCRVRTPQHKGKVEQGGVHYVKRNFLGGREPTRLTQANREVLVWCLTTAGQRCHGTTKEAPLTRFETVERATLRPLPSDPYDVAVWKQLKLARDCYVEFEQCYYSAPYRLVGQRLWVLGGTRQVRIFDSQHQLVATHERAEQPGTRCTHDEHLPPELVPGLRLTRADALEQAATVGPATTQVVTHLLDDPAMERLPTVGRLLKLQETYGASRGCVRASPGLR